MITIKNPEQIAGMRAANALLWEVLNQVCRAVKPGISTGELDALAEALIREKGAEPSFLGYEGYPASLCTSVDDVVVHGIPSRQQILREGSIVSIDCGLVLNGWQADSARTIPVGCISPEAERLIRVTEECFWAGARAARAGSRLGDIGAAVEAVARRNGCGVVRDLTGHGIGREMHEEPAVYNFGLPGTGFPLSAGMTLAIEPMITLGGWRVTEDDDGWGVRTMDHSLCAHHEHTVAIRSEGPPEILSLPGFDWKEAPDGTDSL